VVVGLQVEAVLDGEEVEQAAFGLLGQLGPVAGGEQPLRLRVRLAPRGGMPARAVEGDRQVQESRGGPVRNRWDNGLALPSISLDMMDYKPLIRAHDPPDARQANRLSSISTGILDNRRAAPAEGARTVAPRSAGDHDPFQGAERPCARLAATGSA
jgi:hypothetical protein